MDIEETRENQMGVKSDIYIQPVDSHKQILEHRNSREAYIRSKEVYLQNVTGEEKIVARPGLEPRASRYPCEHSAN